MKPLAVVCVSGGMDSCLTAAIAGGEHRLAFLHANYGQRTEAKELECFRLLAEHFRAERTLVVDFTHLREIGGSSLTDPAVPVREGPPVPGVIPTSYVPFRNAHLLSAAASWGMVSPTLASRHEVQRTGCSAVPARSEERRVGKECV